MSSFDYRQYVGDLGRIRTSTDVQDLIGKYDVVSFTRDEVVRIAEQIETGRPRAALYVHTKAIDEFGTGKEQQETETRPRATLYNTRCDNCGMLLGMHTPRGGRAWCPGQNSRIHFFYAKSLDEFGTGAVPQK